MTQGTNGDRESFGVALRDACKEVIACCRLLAEAVEHETLKDAQTEGEGEGEGEETEAEARLMELAKGLAKATTKLDRLSRPSALTIHGKEVILPYVMPL